MLTGCVTANVVAYFQVFFWESFIFCARLLFCYHTMNSNEVTVDYALFYFMCMSGVAELLMMLALQFSI